MEVPHATLKRKYVDLFLSTMIGFSFKTHVILDKYFVG